MESLVVGAVEEGMLEPGMHLDGAGRIGAFGFLITCLLRYSELLEDHRQ